MAEAILMPKSGISVESCLVGTWKKDVGDRVEIGDILFDYETDKAQFECESTAAGVLLEKFYEEGEEVEVMKPVCAVGEAGEDVSALRGTAGGENAEAGAAADSDAGPAGAAADSGAGPAGATAGSDVGPAGAAAGSDAGPANATAGNNAPAPDAGAIPPQASASPGSKTSPRARNFAERAGVDLGSVTPSGPNGRILEQDVRDAMASGAASAPVAASAPAGTTASAPVAASAPAGTAASAPVAASTPAATPGTAASAPTATPVATAPTATSPTPEDGAAYTDEKFTKIRQVISSSMLGSLREMAQLTHHHSFDATNLLSLRGDFKASADERVSKISVGDMILFAVSRVLKDYPGMNGHLIEGNTLRKFHAVHLGVAIDTPRGLIVPTIFNADRKSLAQISAELKALAEAARSGSINPDVLTGATFTVSNLGPTGVEVFTPIINPPQVAILGVCGSTTKVRMNADRVESYSS
ncbi:MAG: 2-oxo acid dehydrogenase subunit E2, partial [Clostridiales Family XIII bacterium]|nr:2-oxo acid dehydrogenase subunit E2 [Clostridiales Family XIII bacterium]